MGFGPRCRACHGGKVGLSRGTETQPGCRGPRHAEDDGRSARVTTGPADRGCCCGPLSFPDKAVNLTTTPKCLSSQRETCFSASPSSQLGWEMLGWGEARVFHIPSGRGPGDAPAPTSAPGHPTLAWSREAAPSLHRQGACGRRDPGVSGGKDQGPACGSQTLPEIQIHGTSPRPARLRAWSTYCVVRTVAGSQDPVSTAAVLANVLTKALHNPRPPSTQPSTGYRCTGVVHSPGPLWVPKSLPS